MKILIAADGSECSRVAIEQACRIFENSPEPEIEIISVFEFMVPAAGPYAFSAVYVQAIDDEAKAGARSIVEQAAARIREKCPHLANKTSTKVVGGIPAQQIVEEALTWGADLIVTGSHGYGFWKRAWLGSVSNSIVHHAPCSVLVVRGADHPQTADN